MKRNLGGSIDLISGGISLLNTITNLVVDNLPTKHARRVNKAARQLKRKYKDMDVAVYVQTYFADYTPEQQQTVINFLKQIHNL